MEITIEKSLLQDVFSRVAKVVEQKTISPIAGTVKMNVTEDGLVLTAKGNEVFVQAIIEENNFKLESDDTCSVCIPANLLVQLLPKLPQHLNGVIKLSVTPKAQGDYLLTIAPPSSVKKDSKYQIDTLDGSSFFELPDIDKKNSIDLESSQLLEIIDKVPFAAALQQVSVVLLGVQFYSRDDKLITVASDGHRLVELSLDCDSVPEEPINFLCYANGLLDLKDIFYFGEGSEMINVSYGDSHVRFAQGDKVVYVRLIDAEFPEYANGTPSALVPNNFAAEIEVDSRELMEYIKPAAILTNVRLIMSFSPEGIVIKSESERGSSTDTVENIRWISGEPVKRVMFSAAYLGQQLDKFQERVVLKLVGEDKPMVISGDGYFHYLSCINIREDSVEDDDI